MSKADQAIRVANDALSALHDIDSVLLEVSRENLATRIDKVLDSAAEHVCYAQTGRCHNVCHDEESDEWCWETTSFCPPARGMFSSYGVVDHMGKNCRLFPDLYGTVEELNEFRKTNGMDVPYARGSYPAWLIGPCDWIEIPAIEVDGEIVIPARIEQVTERREIGGDIELWHDDQELFTTSRNNHVTVIQYGS
jgi:hypothetical protein